MGGKMSAPQVGELATSPLIFEGSPTPQSGGRTQDGTTNEQIGDITGAAWGSLNTWELGKKLEVAHKWMGCLHGPRICGVLYSSQRRTKSTVAHKGADRLHDPCCVRRPQCCTMGDQINGPQVGASAT